MLYQPKKQEIVEVFNIIDAAKNIGAYKIANVAFAWLYVMSKRNVGIYLFLETDNNNNETIDSIAKLSKDDEMYYDLAVVAYPRTLAGNEAANQNQRFANIPIPLLTATAVVEFLGRIDGIQERMLHERQQYDPDEGEEKNLIDRLKAIMSLEEAQEFCQILEDSCFEDAEEAA
jgi:hypothetical protein